MKKIVLVFALNILLVKADFKPEKLGYSYKALQPSISKQIMKLHYDKHYKGYIKKLNIAVKPYKQLSGKNLEELLQDLSKLPSEIKKTVQDNGGGAFNHALFWKSMHPKGKRKPTEPLLKSIEKQFGSYLQFQKDFNNAANRLFGSGWVWLCSDKKGKLKIVTTVNQDCPLSDGFVPLLNLDLWEHAYYLQYYNKRSDYIQAWWNVVDWREAEKKYQLIVND